MLGLVLGRMRLLFRGDVSSSDSSRNGLFECAKDVDPCGLAPSCLLRRLACTSRRFDGRVGRSVARRLLRYESELRERRDTERQREAGASLKYDLGFTGRLLVTLVHLHTGLPHTALAEPYGLARPTVFRAIGEIRPLPAMRGFPVPEHSGVLLRALADVFAYAEARGSGCGSMAPRSRFAARSQIVSFKAD
ncbi:transposase family protein [Streptomyces sp. NPDC006197]|uniref:transposase family protein n=1 Tax=Streptomyces sp. NPDC006197 TaxID=3156685 RepID=UPI0033B5617C